MGDDQLGGVEELVQDLGALVQDITDAGPIEALPVEVLPFHAIGWFARAVALIARHAILLAFLGAFLESVIVAGLVLPGGTLVALAGAGARMAGLPLPPVVAAACAGLAAGAVVNYALGRAGAARILYHRRAGRLGRWLAGELTAAAPVLSRHGWWIMLVALAFGQGRSALTLAAGASQMPLLRFVRIVLPGAALWSGLYAAGGYFLATEWEWVELAIRRLGWAGAAMAAVAVAAWWLARRRRVRRAASSISSASPAGLANSTSPASPPTLPVVPAGTASEPRRAGARTTW